MVQRRGCDGRMRGRVLSGKRKQLAHAEYRPAHSRFAAVRSTTCTCARARTLSPSHRHAHTHTHSLTHSLTHARTHSLTHARTHACGRLLVARCALHVACCTRSVAAVLPELDPVNELLVLVHRVLLALAAHHVLARRRMRLSVQHAPLQRETAAAHPPAHATAAVRGRQRVRVEWACAVRELGDAPAASGAGAAHRRPSGARAWLTVSYRRPLRPAGSPWVATVAL